MRKAQTRVWYHLRIDVLWQRQLYNDPCVIAISTGIAKRLHRRERERVCGTINRRVGGVLVDLSRECVLRGVRFELHHRRREPHRSARLLLHLHVASRSCGVPSDDVAGQQNTTRTRSMSRGRCVEPFDGVVGRYADHHQVWWSLRWALLHLGSDFVQLMCPGAR